MFTSGFPLRDKLDTAMQRKWFGVPSYPLVPHNGKAAWLQATGASSAAHGASFAATKTYPVGR
jgi:hypothetical protein